MPGLKFAGKGGGESRARVWAVVRVGEQEKKVGC